MTDDTGMFQHASFCVPLRREGYTTDDNARALHVCAMFHRLKKDGKIEALASTYLSFLHYMQKPEGDFHNYLGYERVFRDVDGSPDSFGRSLQALGCVINSKMPRQLRMAAQRIFDGALPRIGKLDWLRAQATSILGLSQYYQANEQDVLLEAAGKLAGNLVEFYRIEAKDDWKWFEPVMSYDNARLTQALFAAYSLTGEQKLLDVAEESMGFLVKTHFVDGVYVPIGNDGWFKEGGNRAIYDQQPLEAAAMVEAAADAYYATRNRDYLQVADTAFEWFLGKNTRKEVMYCVETGGCFDGLSPERVNLNQGAESCVSYLSARLKLEELRRVGLGRKT